MCRSTFWQTATKKLQNAEFRERKKEAFALAAVGHMDLAQDPESSSFGCQIKIDKGFLELSAL